MNQKIIVPFVSNEGIGIYLEIHRSVAGHLIEAFENFSSETEGASERQAKISFANNGWKVSIKMDGTMMLKIMEGMDRELLADIPLPEVLQSVQPAISNPVATVDEYADDPAELGRTHAQHNQEQANAARMRFAMAAAGVVAEGREISRREIAAWLKAHGLPEISPGTYAKIIAEPMYQSYLHRRDTTAADVFRAMDCLLLDAARRHPRRSPR
ncbi:hypothetical protein HFU84_05010 [Acidithiobacillus sp. CV18-2]|nr:hypothetical protein [Acidithiobacillus sp. CV18-3]MBU2758318.1 hypothetical protein [Acidithiobacillus sp. BN09-2]MBU2776876.1 hypothetical protein [Acidithiobacillus sp. CV18-2]MBU2800396.1 hypothetical protein [Acidithiobacillus sp. VAN18-4]